MFIVLFGPAGVGKNYVAEILKKQFGFYFYDADDDVTDEIRERVIARSLVTSEMGVRYFDIVIITTEQTLVRVFSDYSIVRMTLIR